MKGEFAMDNVTERKYTVKAIFSNEADEKFIDDFSFACKSAVGPGAMSREKFAKKFIDNIYGPSVVCVCYSEDGTVAGARALWRNDVDGKTSYQPCDTCVLKEHRKQGLFERMTFDALELCGDEAVIYNYPNDNSRRLYLKLGWEIYAELKPSFWKGSKVYKSLNPEVMTKEYYDWWIKYRNNPNDRYCKKGNEYYLVRSYGRFFNIVVAPITEEIAKMLEKAENRLLLYWSDKVSLYNKKKESRFIVKKGGDGVKIPSWKMDVI